MKPIVVFDFDGTLVDSMGGFEDLAASIMSHFHGCDKTWAQGEYKRTSGLPFPFQLEKIFPKNPHNEQADQAFVEGKIKIYQECPFFEDVEPALSQLKAMGCHLAVSSNNDQEFLNKKISPLKQYFDLVLGYRPNFLKGKDHFRWIQHSIKQGTKDILFVGDSLHDGLMAFENKVDFVARIGTFTPKEFTEQGHSLLEIPTLEPLPDFLSFRMEEKMKTPTSVRSLSKG